MCFCSFVFLCVTSSVSFTGFYTKDEPILDQRMKQMHMYTKGHKIMVKVILTYKIFSSVNSR